MNTVYKTKNKENRKRGFTLIETMIYLGLYGLVIGGVVVAAYAIFESNSRNQSKAMIEEEGTFLLGKIDWALTGASAVSVSPSKQQLSINRDGLIATDEPLSFNSFGGSLTLSRGNNPAQVLNNSNITVTNIIFTDATSSGDGITPESITSSFTLTIRTATGQQFSQVFSDTKYLQK
jgi:Tfp pilus assembly protein PilW